MKKKKICLFDLIGYNVVVHFFDNFPCVSGRLCFDEKMKKFYCDDVSKIKVYFLLTDIYSLEIGFFD